jgi:hypothetical protein
MKNSKERSNEQMDSHLSNWISVCFALSSRQLVATDHAFALSGYGANLRYKSSQPFGLTERDSLSDAVTKGHRDAFPPRTTS